MLDHQSRGGLPSFGDFLEYLHQQGLYITVEHYARVHALLSRVDLNRHTADLKTLLCPLLVTSVSQQEQFYRAFDAYVDVRRQQRVAQLIAPPESLNVEREPQKSEPKRSKFFAPPFLFLLSALIISALLVGGYIYQSRWPSVASPVPASTPPPDTTAAPIPTPGQVADADVGGRWILVAYALALGAPLLVFLLTEVQLFRRRRSKLQRQINKTPILVSDVPVVAEMPSVIQSEQFFTTARLMRGRHLGASREVDVKATAEATAKAVGFPMLKFKKVGSPPEYLILIARASHDDHLAAYFYELSRSLTASGVPVDTFFYEGDPRTCHAAAGESSFQLPELQTYFGRRRLLIFSDGDELINPVTGRLKPWSVMLEYWRDCFLMTPKDLGEWGGKELTLSRQFIVMPATTEGLAKLVDYLESRKLTWPSVPPGAVPVQGVPTQETVGELRRQLGERTFQWLCACAVYPRLQWGLTLHLAPLVMGEGAMTGKNLLDLIRLRWFREGFIPDDMRELLIKELRPRRRATIRKAIIKLLERNPQRDEPATAGEPWGKNVKDLSVDIYELTLAIQRWLYYFDSGDVSGEEYDLPVKAKALETRLGPILGESLPRVSRTLFQKAGVAYLNAGVALRFLAALAVAVVLAYASSSIVRAVVGRLGGDSGRPGATNAESLESALSNLNQTPPTLNPDGSSGVTFTLVPSPARGGGEAVRVVIPVNVEVLQLSLTPAGGAYQDYRATLLTGDGRTVAGALNLPTVNVSDEKRVVLNVPREIMPTGDHEIVLLGNTGSGSYVEVGRYPFRVVSEPEDAGATPPPSPTPAGVEVRVQLLTQAVTQFCPSSGQKVSLRINGRTFSATTNNRGVAVFRNIPCGASATVTSPEFNSGWRVNRTLNCSAGPFDLGAYGDLSGGKLSPDDYESINYGC
jgi:hypothetical protein